MIVLERRVDRGTERQKLLLTNRDTGERMTIMLSTVRRSAARIGIECGDEWHVLRAELAESEAAS